MRAFLGDCYDVIFHYRRGLSRIAGERNIWQGVCVYLLITVAVSLATLLPVPVYPDIGELVPPEIFYFLPLTPRQGLELAWRIIPLLTVITQLVFGPLYFLLRVSLLHFVSVLFGGTGKVSALGAVTGYAYLPYLLVVVGGMLDRYFTLNAATVLMAAAFFWSLWLRIAGVRLVNDFSWGRSALVYFMPLIVLVVSFVLFILLSIVFLAPLLLQAGGGFGGGLK